MNYFDPSGPVVSFTASTAAPTSVQALTKNNVQTPQVLVANASSNLGVIVGWGESDAAAKAAAASTNSANQVYINPGIQTIVVGRPDGFYSGITVASGTALVKVQPGIQG